MTLAADNALDELQAYLIFDVEVEGIMLCQHRAHVLR